jgi:hypothetical protein
LATVEYVPHEVKGKPRRELFDTTDAEGRVVDFHSLRVTFVSGLAAAGVHPRTAQALARHAKIETTMEVYTDLRLLDLRGAVEQLDVPSLEAAGSTVAPTVPSESLPAAETCHEGGDAQAPRFGRNSGEKRQLAAAGCGGSDGTRTRDLRLDRPARATTNCLQ